MIRDRLICGINDVSIQKRLLTEPGLTYAKAVEMTESAETAAQSLRELRGKRESSWPTSNSPQQQSVHRTSDPQTTRESTFTCYRCGRAGHTATKCKVDKDVECHLCGKRGHLRRACKSKSKSGPRKPGRGSKRVRHVGEDQAREEESDSQDSLIHHFSSKGASQAPPSLSM